MRIFKKLTSILLGGIMCFNISAAAINTIAEEARSVEFVTMSGEEVFSETVSMDAEQYLYVGTLTPQPSVLPHRENENGETIFAVEMKVIENSRPSVAVPGVAVEFNEYEYVDGKRKFFKQIASIITTGEHYTTPDFVVDPEHFYAMEIKQLPEGWRRSYNGESSFFTGVMGKDIEMHPDDQFVCRLVNKPPYGKLTFPAVGTADIVLELLDKESYNVYLSGRIEYDEIQRISGFKAEVYSASCELTKSGYVYTMGDKICDWDSTKQPQLTITADYSFENEDEYIYFMLNVLEAPDEYNWYGGYNNHLYPNNDVPYHFGIKAFNILTNSTKMRMLVERAQPEVTLPYVETTTCTNDTTQTMTTTCEVQQGECGSGDANCDSKVSIADSVFIMQCSVLPGKYKMTEQGAKNADVIGNDGVTNADALEIQKFTLGMDCTLSRAKKGG